MTLAALHGSAAYSKVLLKALHDILVPSYTEAGWSGSRAGSFAEIGIRLVLYAKNCLSKRA